MQETLRRIRTRGAAGDRGFTLIELLVVVVIIGILVAIATPTYLNYRKGAANKSAASDVRGAITAVEQFYTDNNVYPDDVVGTKGNPVTLTTTGGTNQTVNVSPGNTVQFDNQGTFYVICAQNDDGKAIYLYNSQSGGTVKKSTQATLATCASTGT
jgi:type IV pilus assembly protein PilA